MSDDNRAGFDFNGIPATVNEDTIDIADHASRQPAPGMNSYRRVLLVEPIYHVHSVGYYQAALDSTGFEDAEFTVVTSVVSDQEAQRLEAFAQSQPRLHLRLLAKHEPISRRVQCSRQYWRVMKQIEEILERESFDFLVYIMVDHTLPIFALPFAKRWFPHHFAMGIRGLAFRHHGLRHTAATPRGKRLEILDRWILGRALCSGVFRRLSFLDREAARRARALEKTPVSGEGVDAVDFPHRDPAEARVALGLSPEDFVFLIFGSLDHRKGVIETMETLRSVVCQDDRVVVLIGGRVAPGLRPHLEETLRTCNFRVVMHDRFISDGDMPNYFAAADCVLCGYKDFAGSSGVLLRSASFGNLGVVSPNGVMEDAVREFGFGEVIDVRDRAGFAASIRRLMHLSPEERAKMSAGAIAYARTHDFRLYMGQFLTPEEAAALKAKA
ncbi:glycosyl transferase group 1 [Chthoniobacter flavus Ellin428]|uniref:Glycosyl transferase group 1 n=1 Tax=Chthoniobacter flavus Ellin428 TaxID=497964 RepID=B4CTT3_9BACT|nr:glycosyltransferase [Chthoniobacter flavus]EDY21971.1 glycosyl transferase group 1 [Chthoniobacter flavus Ellin428]TCO89359.1 hypothetical protein EV701_11493 [Chthoniobacter flavus]